MSINRCYCLVVAVSRCVCGVLWLVALSYGLLLTFLTILFLSFRVENDADMLLV